MVREIELTRKNIEHIKDIVAMQQSYARMSGVVETLTVADLVEDALRMNAGALARHDVHVIRDYADAPPESSWKSTRCCKSWSTSSATPNTPWTIGAGRKSG